MALFLRQRAESGALVFQEGGGLPHLTVLENLAVTGADASRCKEIADTFGLAPHTLGGVMSGGERRQLAVARAMLAQRTLLCLDEPDAGLDIKRIEELGRTLRKLADEGDLAIVAITHSAQLVSAANAERVLVLGHDAKLTEIDAVGGALHEKTLASADREALDSKQRQRRALEKRE